MGREQVFKIHKLETISYYKCCCFQNSMALTQEYTNRWNILEIPEANATYI
jgi:hypothetical protein